MSLKYQDLCEQIIGSIGGKDNITQVLHCATRLRFFIKDQSLVKQDELNGIKAVLGSQFVGGQLQVIIGQYVNELYADLCEILGIKQETAIAENLDAINNNEKKNFKYWFNLFIVTLSDCITPIFPIFLCAGLIKMIATIIGPSILNIFQAESDMITLLNFVGDAGFYFMPIFAAWAAAKKFQVNIAIAMFLAAVLIHPTFMAMATNGTAFSVYGLNITLGNYTSQFLPSILSVYVLAKVSHFLEKHIPSILRMAVVPLLSILIMLPITLGILAPIGTYCGIFISTAAVWISETVGPIAGGLIGGLWYFLVGLGMDKTLLPIIVNNFATQGYDSLFWLSAIAATYALIGIAFAYIFRCHKDEKSVAISNAIALAVGGISEPTIFSTIWRYRKAMLSLFVGGFAGGALASLLGAKAYTIGAGNILFATVCAGGDGKALLPGIIASLVAFAISFAISFTLGFEDKKEA